MLEPPSALLSSSPFPTSPCLWAPLHTGNLDDASYLPGHGLGVFIYNWSFAFLWVSATTRFRCAKDPWEAGQNITWGGNRNGNLATQSFQQIGSFVPCILLLLDRGRHFRYHISVARFVFSFVVSLRGAEGHSACWILGDFRGWRLELLLDRSAVCLAAEARR